MIIKHNYNNGFDGLKTNRLVFMSGPGSAPRFSTTPSLHDDVESLKPKEEITKSVKEKGNDMLRELNKIFLESAPEPDKKQGKSKKRVFTLPK